MWWWSGYHWWPGLVLMCAGMLACMAVMALMMGHGRMPGRGGMCGFWRRSQPRAHQAGTSGQILEERLARGEIDISEYRRIRQTLAKASGPADSEEHAGSSL